MRTVVFSLFLLGAVLFAAEPEPFQGTVTAVNSNGNAPDYCFTAVDTNGKVMMFRISNLQHLDKNDRVALHYLPSPKFPLTVTRIKFLPPAE